MVERWRMFPARKPGITRGWRIFAAILPVSSSQVCPAAAIGRMKAYTASLGRPGTAAFSSLAPVMLGANGAPRPTMMPLAAKLPRSVGLRPALPPVGWLLAASMLARLQAIVLAQLGQQGQMQTISALRPPSRSSPSFYKAQFFGRSSPKCNEQNAIERSKIIDPGGPPVQNERVAQAMTAMALELLTDDFSFHLHQSGRAP